jgi:hypothetical protein
MVYYHLDIRFFITKAFTKPQIPGGLWRGNYYPKTEIVQEGTWNFWRGEVDV